MKFLLIFISILLLIIATTYAYIKNESKTLLYAKYEHIQKNIEKSIETLIENKINSTKTLSILLSKDKNIASLIENKNYQHIDYTKLINEFKIHTNFKNVWIQVIDKNGISKYRSWEKAKNLNLKVREDIQKSLKTKQKISTISVGKSTIAVRTITPIFGKNNNFIGLIEIIMHFNSIEKKLKELNIESILLTHKKYKKRLKNSYTKNFLQDYYLSNLNTNLSLVKYLNEQNIEVFLEKKEFSVSSKHLYMTYTISSQFDKEIGYIINRIALSHIDIDEINSFKIQTTILMSIFLTILTLTFLFYIYQIHSKNVDKLNKRLRKHIIQLKIQENNKQSILDSQLNIIVITNGKNIISCNKQLFQFFKKIKSLQEFKDTYKCICSSFEDMEDDSYIIEKNYNGKNWAEHILSNQKQNFKAAIFNEEKELCHFSINVSQEKSLEYIIVTLTDITAEIEQKIKLKYLNSNLEKLVENKTKELKELNESLEKRIENEVKTSKNKDTLLFQQSKMTAIAETLKNIAHQWRQPLSVISTATSGMQVQKDINVLDDKIFENACEIILNNTRYLSKTIDDFTNFFIEEKQKTKFSLTSSIGNSIKLLNSTFEEKNIKIKFTYDKDIILLGYKNEFQQAIVSILDNSIFAIEKEQQSKERYIFLELKNGVLEIKDNGKGIKEKDLIHVFEPYFTTKHQAFGIGIGLYMVQEVLIKHMKFKIDIQNVTFEYKKSIYKGVNFSINFN